MYKLLENWDEIGTDRSVYDSTENSNNYGLGMIC